MFESVCVFESVCLRECVCVRALRDVEAPVVWTSIRNCPKKVYIKVPLPWFGLCHSTLTPAGTPSLH